MGVVQAAFHNGNISGEITWKMVVLIAKGDGREFRGIGLVEVLWKTITVILNWSLTSAIIFHYIIHGFRSGRGMDTTTREAKLLQRLMNTREAVLHEILMELQKAYYALDRDRCLGILVGYSVVPRALRLLWMYWSQLTMVAKARG